MTTARMTRPTAERVDDILRWHGMGHGCEQLIADSPPEYEGRQLCELALEVNALRDELAQTRVELFTCVSSLSPERIAAFNELMREAAAEIVELRAALQRDIQAHKDAM